jgi:hypothetical protein
MPTHTQRTDHKPYDIMVGVWMGTAVSFSPEGKQVSAGLSRNIVYWKTPPANGREGILRFRQDQGITKEIPATDLAGLFFAEYDLKVTDKHAESIPQRSVAQQDMPKMKLVGVETRPDVYHFHGTETVRQKISGTERFEEKTFHWYNSHYFASPDERHIMGPLVNDKGEVGLIHVQIFTRVSYDVPTESKYQGD